MSTYLFSTLAILNISEVSISYSKNIGSFNPQWIIARSKSEEINFDMSDNEVQPILKTKIDESVTSAFEVLRKRIDKFGVTQPNIQRLGNSGRILVELPGAKDIERVKGLLQSTAQLEFWDAFKGEEFLSFMIQANEIIKSKTSNKTADKTELSEVEELLGSDNDSIAIEKNPILDLIKGQGYQGGPIIAQFDSKNTNIISEYLSDPDVKSLLQPSFCPLFQSIKHTKFFKSVNKL